MKRICLLGAAIAGLFIIGVATAMAATPHASVRAVAAKKGTSKKGTSKKSAKGKKVSCKLSLSVQVPAGNVDVTQGSTDGTEFGSAGCGRPLGTGVESASFTTDAGGDLIGKWQQYFKAGTVYGTYDLTPVSTGPTTPGTFTAASYTGTVTVKAGTGTDLGDTGTGTLTCTTLDVIHYSCTEGLRLVLPATVITG